MKKRALHLNDKQILDLSEKLLNLSIYLLWPLWTYFKFLRSEHPKTVPRKSLAVSSFKLLWKLIRKLHGIASFLRKQWKLRVAANYCRIFGANFESHARKGEAGKVFGMAKLKLLFPFRFTVEPPNKQQSKWMLCCQQSCLLIVVTS